MKKTSKLIIYKLIIDRIRNHPSSFQELDDYLSDVTIHEEDLSISKRTFNRYQQEISLIFGIDIEYNYATEKYHITFSEDESVSNRLIEALDTFTALNIDNSVKKYIDLEKRPVSGTEHLGTLLKAVKQRNEITFNYHKYWQNTLEIRTIQPYLIKEHKNRWYVMGKDKKHGKIRTFGTDRITDLVVYKTNFNVEKNFNPKDYFKYNFGITRGEDKPNPEKVVLSFTASQGQYIKSLPLHPSQKILEDTKERFVIELYLVLTFDFYMEILSYGEHVTILEPSQARDEIISRLKLTLEQYEE